MQARHLSILCLRPAPTQEVFDYLDTLFPCSRIVVNLRRDRRAQARALVSSFFDAEDSLAESTPPLTLVERDVERVSQFLLEWHQNKSSTGRSFLMYTEDMTAERFTQLAQWLGRPCTFGSVPNANEFDAGQKLGKEREEIPAPDLREIEACRGGETVQYWVHIGVQECDMRLLR